MEKHLQKNPVHCNGYILLPSPLLPFLENQPHLSYHLLFLEFTQDHDDRTLYNITKMFKTPKKIPYFLLKFFAHRGKEELPRPKTYYYLGKQWQKRYVAL
jgi:hypothetical protein